MQAVEEVEYEDELGKPVGDMQFVRRPAQYCSEGASVLPQLLQTFQLCHRALS